MTELIENVALHHMIGALLEMIKEEVVFKDKMELVLGQGAIEEEGDIYQVKIKAEVVAVAKLGTDHILNEDCEPVVDEVASAEVRAYKAQLSVGTADEWVEVKDGPVDEEKIITLTAAATASDVKGKIIPDFDIGYYSGDKHTPDEELTLDKLDKARASMGNLMARSSFDIRDTMLGPPHMQDPVLPDPPDLEETKALIPTRRRWDNPPQKPTDPELLRYNTEAQMKFNPPEHVVKSVQKTREEIAADFPPRNKSCELGPISWLKPIRDAGFRQEYQMDPALLEEFKQEREEHYQRMRDWMLYGAWGTRHEAGEISTGDWMKMGLKHKIKEEDRAIDRERVLAEQAAKIHAQQLEQQLAASAMSAVNVAVQSSDWFQKHWVNYVRDGDGDMKESFMDYLARINAGGKKAVDEFVDPAEVYKQMTEGLLGHAPPSDDPAAPNPVTPEGMTDRLKQIMERHRQRAAAHKRPHEELPAPNDWEVKRTGSMHQPVDLGPKEERLYGEDSAPDPGAVDKAEEAPVDYMDITRRMF